MKKVLELGMRQALAFIKRGDWLNNPYHNYAHTENVVNNVINIGLSEGVERIRPLVLAALFHDVGHYSKDDSLNIKEALSNLEVFFNQYPVECFSTWKCQWEEVSGLIKATQYPYQLEDSALLLGEMIIRDADTLQCFDNVVQTAINLHVLEGGLTYQQAIEKQKKFIKTHRYYTQTARNIAARKRKEALQDAW